MSYWSAIYPFIDDVEGYFIYVFYFLSIMANVFFFTFIMLTENKKNWRLLLEVISMMFTAAGFFIGKYCYSHKNYYTGAISSAIANSSDLLVHWMFCYIYLKLSIEVRFLLDRRIYTTNQDIILKRNRWSLSLEIANILNFLVVIAILVYKLWTGKYHSQLMY
jgi:hypothetical protein